MKKCFDDFFYSPDSPIHLMVLILLMKNLDYEGYVFSNVFTAYDNFYSKNMNQCVYYVFRNDLWGWDFFFFS